MHHVILGVGPAGVTAAETLRNSDPSAQITLIGDEPEPPYGRMAIPYLLAGDISEQGTYLRKGDGHFTDQGIEVLRDRCVALAADRNQIRLASGAEMDFDRLLIATGSSPVKPPIPGTDLPGVQGCWTLEDAREIGRRVGPGKEAVLIGAGFIGCIILEAMVASGCSLTVVELGDRMVPRMLNPTAGGMLKSWCEAKGVRVHTDASVEAIGQDGDRLRVTLEGGDNLVADVVVTATGVRSNMAFLEGSGVKTDAGVLVDEHMQTNRNGVFAAGDVAQALDFSTGGWEVQAIQPTAVEHGRVAAMNMANPGAIRHDGSLNMNVLDTLGLLSASFGQWQGVEGGDSAESVDADDYRYIGLQFDGDRLVGATSIGHSEHIGVLRGLIQGRRGLGRWKGVLMNDPTRLMEAYVGLTHGMSG
ncbi:MAG: NAD(P)/FAD-dependent oxidoreductase [Gammaproteobacteria bacterium]